MERIKVQHTRPTRREFGQSIGAATLGAASLSLSLPLTGCGQSSVTTYLQDVLAVAEIVLPLIPGVDPAVATQITNYLSAVSDGVTFATAELASTDSTLMKADKIVARFAAIVKPDLPPGTAQTIVNDIANVAAAIAKFLTTIQVSSAAARNAKAAGKPAPELTKGDLAALPKIAARAQALKARLHQ